MGRLRSWYENNTAFQTVELTSITDVAFPEGSIHGVTFTTSPGTGVPPSVSVPAGTEFVFQTAGVPEPATWAMLIAGLGVLGLRLRMSPGSLRLRMEPSRKPAASL